MEPCQGSEMGSTPITRSMLFGLFSKLTREKTLSEKMASSDAGVYLYMLFPIAVSFLITFGLSRLVSHLRPDFYVKLIPGLRIHHYSYGIFILAMAGYIALVNTSARDRYLTSLLYGVGLGLAFDEFGFWLRLTDESSARWSYDGLIVLVAFFILMVSAESGMQMWDRHFHKKPPEKSLILASEKAPMEPPLTP